MEVLLRLKLGIAMCLFLTIPVTSQTNKKYEREYSANSVSSQSYAKININNISTIIYNNGIADLSLGNNDYFQYPKGTGNAVFYASGLLWGGYLGDYWAAGGSAYNSGLKPGRVLPDGTAENVNSPYVRVYRVRSDYKNFTDEESKNNLYSAEIIDEGKTADEIFAQYDLDWKQWPAQYGAPFIDKNNNGIYEPDFDIPGMTESPCQTLWYAANDLDPAVTTSLYGALPLKIEMQCTCWALKGEDPHNNMIYKRYRIINRNSIKIDSLYLMAWSDPDIGIGFSDLTGCDTLLSLGYVYKAAGGYYDANPSAAGFVMLQSPYIKGMPSDTAVIDNRVITGYKNLGMTAFYAGMKSFVDYGDPVTGSYAKGALMLKNYMQSKLGISGTPIIDPNTNKSTKFPYSGNPVTGTGWLDGLQFAPSDRRMGIISGSFSMDAGDTQQIVFAQAVAGGTDKTDNIQAVALLEYYAGNVQKTWQSALKSKPPESPVVSVAEFDGELLLNWGDPAAYSQSEKDLNQIYKFQGYNIYQFPNENSLFSEGVRLKTYDKIDNLTTIYGWVEDPVNGYLENRVVGFGKNTGLYRYYHITADSVGVKKPLYNFSKYYFGVTSYYAADDPEMVPRVIESAPQIITAMPQPAKPGIKITGKYGNQIAPAHTAGRGEGTVSLKVIDPFKGDGMHYQISFNDEAHYNILRENAPLLTNQFINGLAPEAPVIGGVQIYVKAPQGRGLKTWNNYRGSNPYYGYSDDLWFVNNFYTSLWYGGLQIGYAWFNGGTYGSEIKGSSVESYSKFRNIIIKFAVTDTSGNFSDTDPNASLGYRFLKGANQPPAAPAFAPYIKNNIDFGFQEYGLNGRANVPLAAYDADTGERLDVGFLESNEEGGMVDGRYWPPLSVPAGGPGNKKAKEILFIFDTGYTASSKPDYMKPGREIFYNTQYGPLPIQYWIESSRIKDQFSSYDEIKITSYALFSTADKYEFIIPAPLTGADLAKEETDKINVFPNPYYGVNPQEINQYQRFVTFTHLPQRAEIKIFNLAGQLIRVLKKEDAGQTIRWNLATDNNLFIPSGIYVAHIELPDLGKVKTLKIAIILEQQYPAHF